MDIILTPRQSRKSNQGFTLIELVVVIVILGILAATVSPKFVSFTAEAKTSTIDAVKASVQGASALVYSKSIVAGNQNIHSGSSPTITLPDDLPLDISYGYPLTNTSDWKNRLLDLDLDTFDMLNAVDGSLIIYRKDVYEFPNLPITTSFSCIVFYKRVSNAGDTPVIESNECT